MDLFPCKHHGQSDLTIDTFVKRDAWVTSVLPVLMTFMKLHFKIKHDHLHKSTGDMMTFILRSSSVDSLFQPTLSIFDLRPNGIKSFLFAPSVAFDMPPPSIPFIIYGILQTRSYVLLINGSGFSSRAVSRT
ncbi:hypothetical protein TNCT_649681 [Trichonephila clavata]|uniref:Uncharacterized protein n=1 Tax=Trichonephila clavata TaxID=2740835 RepID=A0A8X6KY80_TRICU|nr:hypothetical protein TNCT_649681 [Trichonephila clavata]